MQIQLDKWEMPNVNLEATKESGKNDNSFDLGVGQFFPEDNTQSFGVSFSVHVKDKNFNLNIEAHYYFTINKPLTEEFKLSDFPKINAPAIAFPYLRAYISNLTLQSGYDPIILPSINFIALAKEKDNTKK